MHNPVIVSDLDGTLLTSWGCIPLPTLNWMANWMAQGGQFVIATGRHYRNIKSLFAGCSHQPHLITANGAMINDRLALSPAACRVPHLAEMTELAQHYRTHFSVFTDAGWHVTTRDEMVNAHDFDAFLTEDTDFVRLHAFKGLFYGEPAILRTLQQRLRIQFSDLQVVLSDPYWLEVQRKGINKFSTLQSLLTQLNLSNQPTLAFGDGLNDLELLSGCTQGVIMGNAMSDLRVLLPELPVALSNDAEGVRMYLETLLP